METLRPSRVRLGDFTLDLRAGELLGSQGKLVLQQQPFQLLLTLVEARGEVVTREEIRKKLWPNDTVVEFDHAINTAIKKLRQAFDDSADHPKYIETVARRGYRLMVPVERVGVFSDSESAAGSEDQSNSAVRAPDEIDRPQPAAASGTLIGRKVSHYRVLEILGGGGMGVVYRAEDLKLGRAVALKFLPEELSGDPSALARFEREARAASALEHPNICPVYEFDEYEGQPFIAMQLLSGQTLRDLIGIGAGRVPAQSGCQEGTPLEPEKLLDLAIQTAAGLEAAHSQGIIHRDIKPANIFITTRSEAKILDFGLAKLVDLVEEQPHAGAGRDGQQGRSQQDRPATASANPHLTRTGMAMGTASYMSPEQIRDEKLDARTDLFSLGLVLYEMATGHQAFYGPTAAIIHEAILNRAPEPITSVNPHLPVRLQEIIGRALEKDRELRYQSAGEMCAELRLLKREMDSGRSEVGAGLGLALRRWPLWLAGLLAAVVVSLAVGWFVWHQAGTRPQAVERQITANPPENWVTGAAISPDGKYVAYHDQTGLYLRSTDSGETRAVPLPEGFHDRLLDLEWFPDGGRLVAGALGSTGFDLWVITALGGEPPHLLYPGYQPAVSPDGQHVAFITGGRNTAGAAWIGGTNGEIPRNILAGEESVIVFSPVWSPDGGWIAYATYRKTAQGAFTSAIEVRPSRGGPPKTVVSEASLAEGSSICYVTTNGSCLRWSPDWRLVFSTRRTANAHSVSDEYGLWEVPVEPGTGAAAGTPERVAHWSGLGPVSPTISADGKRLSFLKADNWQDVYLGELAPDGASMKTPRRFTLDNRGSYPNDWTRDCKSIIFTSNRTGKSEIFRQRIQQNVAETLVRGPEDDRDAVLSPDGLWLLYRESARTELARADSPSRLMRRPVGGGASEKLADEPADVSEDCACPRKLGSPCVLGREEGKRLVFYTLDPVRGQGERLGEIEGSLGFGGWSVSPDGSRLAFVGGVNTYRGAIEVLTFRSHTWDKVPVDMAWGDLQSVAWAADGGGFFATSFLPGSFNLLHITLAGKVSALLRNARRQSLVDPLPSPDGRYLAFRAETWDRNVWMFENF